MSRLTFCRCSLPLLAMGILWSCNFEVTSGEEQNQRGVSGPKTVKIITHANPIDQSGFLTDGEPKDLPPQKIVGSVTRYIANRVMLGRDDTGMSVEGIYIRPGGLLDPGPGLVVLHNRFGLSRGFLEMQLDFVAQGYRVMALDLYGYVPKDEKEGQTLEDFLTNSRLSKLIAKVNLAANRLSKEYNAIKVGLIGWDTGGRWVTDIAVINDDDRAIVSAFVNFYGNPVKLMDNSARLTVPYFGIFAIEDKLYSDYVPKLEELFRTSTNATIRSWPGVPTGFFEPYRDIEYNEEEAKKAMAEVNGFLVKYLK